VWRGEGRRSVVVPFFRRVDRVMKRRENESRVWSPDVEA
jgi:hypothetical protein